MTVPSIDIAVIGSLGIMLGGEVGQLNLFLFNFMQANG
jgi:hypothetical protein